MFLFIFLSFLAALIINEEKDKITTVILSQFVVQIFTDKIKEQLKIITDHIIDKNLEHVLLVSVYYTECHYIIQFLENQLNFSSFFSANSEN